ncbi:hypothetical protein [Lyngbya sp. CCY1209]|jgi:hypothetical protein|uniref:hypothetical protein n=1 Tax=Lyngbya sp. CCY1209 TaxID=2886103 RepID=UPI002D204141|nr:hypothetical protein [Lyngbya sp. CCY1209]MEB3887296.1 hypothetical protein [Lyngbya sp. CCY1209]
MDILLEGGAALEKRDYTLIVDRSQSMAMPADKGGRSRWELMQTSTLELATYCEHFDPDGIAIYLFADDFQRYDRITSDHIGELFKDRKPAGKANLGAVLKDATDRYFERRAMERSQPNGETILVVTGGEIVNPLLEIKRILVNASNQLSHEEELAIELISVGADARATEFFRMLDDELQASGAKYDICDTVTLEDVEEISLTDVLLRAITD